jgi:hypothetical protein
MKKPKTHIGEKTASSTNGARKTGYLHVCRKLKLDPSFILYKYHFKDYKYHYKKLKSLCTTKETVTRLKRQSQNGRKIWPAIYLTRD